MVVSSSCLRDVVLEISAARVIRGLLCLDFHENLARRWNERKQKLKRETLPLKFTIVHKLTKSEAQNCTRIFGRRSKCKISHSLIDKWKFQTTPSFVFHAITNHSDSTCRSPVIRIIILVSCQWVHSARACAQRYAVRLKAYAHLSDSFHFTFPVHCTFFELCLQSLVQGTLDHGCLSPSSIGTISSTMSLTSQFPTLSMTCTCKIKRQKVNSY